MSSSETSTGYEGGDFDASENGNFDENFRGKDSGAYFKHCSWDPDTGLMKTSDN